MANFARRVEEAGDGVGALDGAEVGVVGGNGPNRGGRKANVGEGSSGEVRSDRGGDGGVGGE